MSDIVKARKLISDAQFHIHAASILITDALLKMKRAPLVRPRARAKHIPIDDELRERVKRLARRYPNWTTQEIAVRCGLRSAGRVSEILHNHR